MTNFVFSQIKDIKTYQPKFSFCNLGHAPGIGLGVAGGKKQVWGFAMAPHRLHVLVIFILNYMNHIKCIKKTTEGYKQAFDAQHFQRKQQKVVCCK